MELSSFTSLFDWVFTSLSTLLSTPPFVWLFGLVFLLFVIKIVKMLISF